MNQELKTERAQGGNLGSSRTFQRRQKGDRPR